MAKKLKIANDDEVSITVNGKVLTFKNQETLERQISEGVIDPTNILAGKLKEGYCVYSYDIVAGLGSGSKNSREGKTCLVKAELESAFRDLRIHMAYIDDRFTDSDTMRINEMTDNAMALNYTIHGFAISGSGMNETVTIIGEKFVESVGDHVGWKSPRIEIGELSKYKFADHLNKVVAECREEVRKYHHGNYTKEVAERIPEVDPSQTSILDHSNVTDELESAKV